MSELTEAMETISFLLNQIAVMDPEAEEYEARCASVLVTVNKILPGVYSTPSTDDEEIQRKIQFAIRLASFTNEGNGPVVDILKSISYDVLGLSLLATGMDDEGNFQLSNVN